ncbi:DMT family transporter, partial [Mesorhizobium sp. M0047]
CAPSASIFKPLSPRKWKNVPNGILLALIAYASYSGSDAVVKSLGGQLSVFEIGFFITLFAGFFLIFTRPADERWRDFWRTRRPWAVQARAWAGIASGVLSVYAFTTIPLAECYALIFLAPLCVTILSVAILGEKVGPWRWLAVVAGQDHLRCLRPAASERQGLAA